MNKRTFLKATAWIGISQLFSPFRGGGLFAKEHSAPLAAGYEETPDFWEDVRRSYNLNDSFINLENGYYNIMPKEILDKYYAHIEYVNKEGAHYMRTVQAENKLTAAAMVAEVAGCSPEELIITRNTTEALDMIISGFDWKAGDQAVMADQDYGAMLDMFEQVVKRHDIVAKIIDLPTDPKSDDEIVKLYEAAITPRTKLLMVCHIVNITGQILPVRKICDMAHKHGVQVMVDGAHALAHIQFKLTDLNCDYYGTSLHKWLSVPIGAGFLYIKKEHIPNVWPLFAEAGKKETDVLRLNHTGTHPPATDLTIADAIAYYKKIGPAKKEERLRYLQEYWTKDVVKLPKIINFSPTQSSRKCAIATVGVKGMSPTTLAETLMKQYNIYTVAINNDRAGVHGVRITPNVFTTTNELDKLKEALKTIAS